jgi:large subunit ribosomal protein L7/L12
MSLEADTILEKIKTLRLIDAVYLIKSIETTFGVDASSIANPVGFTLPNAAVSEVEVPTKFDVVLETVPSNKRIPIIKVIRTLTSLGLKEAKNMIESMPQVIKSGVEKNVAEEAKLLLEEVGATVTVQAKEG